MKTNFFYCPFCEDNTRHLEVSLAEATALLTENTAIRITAGIADSSCITRPLQGITGIRVWKCSKCTSVTVRTVDGSVLYEIRENEPTRKANTPNVINNDNRHFISNNYLIQILLNNSRQEPKTEVDSKQKEDAVTIERKGTKISGYREWESGLKKIEDEDLYDIILERPQGVAYDIAKFLQETYLQDCSILDIVNDLCKNERVLIKMRCKKDDALALRSRLEDDGFGKYITISKTNWNH